MQLGKIVDLTGLKVGMLTPLYRIEDRQPGYSKWFCRCDCGGSIVVDSRRLQRGTVTNCGCVPKTSARHGRIAEDLRGRKFGKLTVLSRAENKNGRVQWLCRCDCGKEKLCIAHDLKAGNVKSCGCLQKGGLDGARDLSGLRFGRLTALSQTGERDRKGSLKWLCRCDCGKNCVRTEDALVNGRSVSCGCRKKEINEQIYKEISFFEGTSYEFLKYRKGVRSDSNSGYRGIALRKNGRYAVHIGFKGKRYFLGMYGDLKEALETRREAEQLLHEGFCDAYERWKRLSRGEEWEKNNMLIYEVEYHKGNFRVTTNIDALEKQASNVESAKAVRTGARPENVSFFEKDRDQSHR